MAGCMVGPSLSQTQPATSPFLPSLPGHPMDSKLAEKERQKKNNHNMSEAS